MQDHYHQKIDDPTNFSQKVRQRAKWIVVGVLLAVTSVACVSSITQNNPQASFPIVRTLSSDATAFSPLPKVCIIGAGPSGLSLADSLLQKGYSDIVVFEKESVPGGKCQSYVAPGGRRFSMGAIQGTDLSYPLSIQYLKKYNVTRRPFNRGTYFYEYTTGQSMEYTQVNYAYSTTQVAIAVQTYMALWNTYSSYLKPGFPNGIPLALTETIRDFMQANNLWPLAPIFYRVMTLYGYGSANRVPAVYAFVLVTDKVLGGAYGVLSNPVWLADFPLLMTRLATDLQTRGVRFIYNAKISNVDRGTANIKIQYSVDSIAKSEDCHKLVVAFPQKLDALSFLGLDARETAVFTPVWVHHYIVSMVRTNMNIGSRFYQNLLRLIPNTTTVEFANTDAAGQPIQFAREYPAFTNITTVYSWARSALYEDTIGVNATTISTLQKVDPQQQPPLTSSSILKTAPNHFYFPHVKTPIMQNNWYGSFEQLQGYRGTYWTSGLRFFELVESTIASSQDLAMKYF